MRRRDRIAYLRKEQRELLGLAGTIETALALASQKEIPQHEQGLAQLRELDHGLTGIAEHCHSEERIVESVFHHYLAQRERVRLNKEHTDILRGLADFREELRFATIDRTTSLVAPGVALIRQLREHIAYEESLLARIAASAEDQKKKHKHPPCHRARTAEPRTTKQGAPARRERPNIPYTMEPHPELF